MNEFSIRYEAKESYLLITGKGCRKNLSEVLEGTREVAKAVSATNCRYLLVDYSAVYTKLPVADAFNIVRIYESKVTEFQNIVMAVVINPEEEQFDSFWEKICRIRGFQFKIFTNLPEAEEWILTKINNSI